MGDFEYFVQWMYTRTLTHENLDGPHPAYFRLVRLWKVGDWLQVSEILDLRLLWSYFRAQIRRIRSDGRVALQNDSTGEG